MNKTIANIALASLAVVSLGGCKSIFAWHRVHDVRPVGLAHTEDPGSWSVEQLQTGRRALDAGAYAEAITAFSNVRSVPGYEAEAFNGLAIAYSNIGRNDLARAYFQRAIAWAPNDARFQRNLATLDAANAAARAEAASALASAQAASRSSLPSSLHLEKPGARVMRLSAGEVRLFSDPSVATSDAPNAQYPVRVRLTQTGARQFNIVSPPQAEPSYPIRVTFGHKPAQQARRR